MKFFFWMFSQAQRTSLLRKSCRHAGTGRLAVEQLEPRCLLSATLVLPQTSVPTFVATYNVIEAGNTVQVDAPIAGGNFLGTLNGTPLTSTYCVNIDQTIFTSTTYNNAAVTSDGTAYGTAVANAGAISWLLTNLGPTATTTTQQDALQAAIWRTEYGTTFQLDSVDNSNGAPMFNSTIGPIYKADLAALGTNTEPVSMISWISPGPNPDTTQGQALAAPAVQAPPAALSFLGTAGNGTVVANLPGAGVWRFENATGWQQLTATDAAQVGVDANGDVVALLNGAGVWRWEDASGWIQLTASSPEQVSIAGNGIVTVLFATAGVWRWEDTSAWVQLTASTATDVGVDARGDVVATFANAGVWRWEDTSGWLQLTQSTPVQVGIGGNGYVVAAFQGAGVWRWEDASGWVQLTQSSSAQVGIDDRGDLVAMLAGAGVWRWEDAVGWQQLTATNASQVGIGGNGNVVAELPGLGVWRFEDGVGWQLLTSTNAG